VANESVVKVGLSSIYIPPRVTAPRFVLGPE